MQTDPTHSSLLAGPSRACARWVAPLALVTLVPALAAAQTSQSASAQANVSGSSDTTSADASGTTQPAAEQQLHPMPVVDTGPQAGFRTGFALGSGKTTTADQSLSSVVSGSLPLWLDLGYRVIPSLFVGAYGQIGFAFLKKGDTCKGSDASCTGQDYRLGLELAYHFNAAGQYDPWVGIGAGYEWLKLNVHYSDTFYGSYNTSLRGLEMVNVQLGLDVRPTRQGGIGPFVAFTMAQYNHYKTAHVTQESVEAAAGSVSASQTHQWIMFGIQGSYFDDL